MGFEEAEEEEQDQEQVLALSLCQSRRDRLEVPQMDRQYWNRPDHLEELSMDRELVLGEFACPLALAVSCGFRGGDQGEEDLAETVELQAAHLRRRHFPRCVQVLALPH